MKGSDMIQRGMLGSRRIDAEERHDEIHADERLDIVMRLAASRVSDRICVHGSALCGTGLVGENGASGIGKDGTIGRVGRACARGPSRGMRVGADL